jgi:hypothetical protein
VTLHPHEFIRRFLSHVLPKGFHRIRHYGLFASSNLPPTSHAHANRSVLLRPSLSLKSRRPLLRMSRPSCPAPALAAAAG